MGLARRAARKLPVVLTLGSGPSGFPRTLSGRRPKLPRQPRRGATLALAPVILTLGAGPSGFSKQLSERRPKLSRQPWQTRAVARARSVILALGAVARRASRNNFPGDGQSATASLALASVVLALGVGPTGNPKQVSERCKAGGSWTPTAMANPRRRTRALRYFGAGGWPVGLPETTFRAKLPRQPWQTRAVARARSVILALGAGPSGFPKQVSERSKRGDLGGRRGICGPKPISQHGRPRLSRARTRQSELQLYQGPPAAVAVLSKPMAVLSSFINNGRFIKVEDQDGCGRLLYQGRGPGLAVLDSGHIVPYKEFISGQAEQFLGKLAKRMATLSRPASRNCRFIKF